MMEKIQWDGTELIYYLLLMTSEQVCKQAYKQNLLKGLANESGEQNQPNALQNISQSSTTPKDDSIASSSGGSAAADEKEDGDGVGGRGQSIIVSRESEKWGSSGVESSSQAREEVHRITTTTIRTTDDQVEASGGGGSDGVVSLMQQEPLTEPSSSLSSSSALAPSPSSPASKGALSVSEKEKDVRPAHELVNDSPGRPSPSPSPSAPSSTAAAAAIQVGGGVAAAVGASSPSAAASPSAGKKRSKKGRFAKKSAAAKKKLEKDSSEEASAAAEVAQAGDDSGTLMQTSPQQQEQQQQKDAEQNKHDAHEPDPEPEADNGRQSRSITNMAHDRRAEGHEAAGLSSLSVDEVAPVPRHDHIVQDRKPKTQEIAGVADDATVQKHGVNAPAEPSFRPSRSFGRWADVVAEETEDRLPKVMNGMELDGPSVGDVAGPERSKNRKERERELAKGAEQSLEGSPRNSFKAGGGGRSVADKHQGVGDGSQNENSRAQSTKGVEKEHQAIEAELGGGKSQQAGLEGSRTPDEREENWINRKEQDSRGKPQQPQQQLGTSQAARELNWRRRGWNSGGEQDSPRSPNNGGFDGDNKKDEQQDFRARAPYGTEPQATHKNWVNRRGIQRQGEVDGRAEQNKTRGKGKQGREPSGPQTTTTAAANTQHVKDAARQKFEADLRIKKEELLLKSKQSLKAEFQKAKRIEQAKKGSDDLEAELNKNLVYEEGELFFLNF